MGRKSSEILRNIGFLTSGRLAILFVNFLTMAVLARLISPSEFGVMAAVLIVMGLSDSIFTGAFGLGVTQKKGVDAPYLTVVYFLAISVSLVFVIIIFIASGWIERFFGFADLGAALRFAALAFPFRAGESVASSLLRRHDRFKALAGYQLLCPLLVYGPISIGLAFLHWGVWALITGNLALSIVSAVSSFMLSRFGRQICTDLKRLRPALKLAIAEEFLGKNVFFLLSNLLNWVALTGPNTIIGHRLGAVQLGLYARSWRLLDLATGVSATPINNVLLSTFSRMQDDHVGSGRALVRSLAVATLFFAIASAFFVIHAGLLVQVALGSRWADAVPILQILFAALVPRCCYKVSETMMVSFGYSRLAAKRQALYALLMTAGALIAVSHGPLWVAASSSISITLFYMTSLSGARRLIGVPVRDLIVVHLRALAAFLVLVVPDLAIRAAMRGQDLLITEGMSLICSACTLVLGAVLLPERVLGKDIAAAVRASLSVFGRVFRGRQVSA